MLKLVAFSLCTAQTVICTEAKQLPRIDMSNGVSRYETLLRIVYSGGDERCEYQKESDTYAYETHGFPASQEQSYFRRRYEALKCKFEQKN